MLGFRGVTYHLDCGMGQTIGDCESVGREQGKYPAGGRVQRVTLGGAVS